MGQLGGAVSRALALKSGVQIWPQTKYLILTRCVTLGKSLNPNYQKKKKKHYFTSLPLYHLGGKKKLP